MTESRLQKIIDKLRTHQGSYTTTVCVCAGAGCLSSGGDQVMEKIRGMVQGDGLEKVVNVVPTGCMGPCNQGPLVKFREDDTVYEKLTPETAEQVFDDHYKKNEIVKDKLLFSGSGGTPVEKAQETVYYKKQEKIVLENCGNINPESLLDYLDAGGYQSLEKTLFEMQPVEVIQEIKGSGLRGRGGAGYPTGLKWEMVHHYQADQKYVICNGDEGDPGAFMDRSVLEGDPHRVIEGMTIAGYAVGANKGYLYVRAEYPLAIKRFQEAIKDARSNRLIGPKILDGDFSFDIEIRVGAGAFVCGEETALIHSIEGERGTPRPRPPYPAEVGLWGKPTLINNVETFANIAPIIRSGSRWFRAIGTEKSAGTKVFALAGKVKHTGLIEVPMGMSLREIIYDIGGGIADNRPFKAAQTGGPSGGCITEENLSVPVDYENLARLGSIMGSGGLIVMDDSSNMVDVARFFMEFCMDESCGKCVPCRVGTKHMFDLLDKICKGEGTERDLQLLEQLAPMVKETSLCGLGMTAPNPLLSTLKYFRHEYMELIQGRKTGAECAKS